MNTIHRPDKPKREDLIRLYKAINKIIRDDDCYYKDEEMKGKVKL